MTIWEFDGLLSREVMAKLVPFARNDGEFTKLCAVVKDILASANVVKNSGK